MILWGNFRIFVIDEMILFVLFRMASPELPHIPFLEYRATRD